MDLGEFLRHDWQVDEQFYFVTEDVLSLNNKLFSIPGDISVVKYKEEDKSYYKSYCRRCFFKLEPAKRYYISEMSTAMVEIDTAKDIKLLEVKTLEKKKEELGKRLANILHNN